MIPYKVPELPWKKIAAGFLQLGGEDYLLVTGYFSTYVEPGRRKDSTSSPEVIMHLRSIMARHGIPQEIVFDNGPQLLSNRFRIFAKQWKFFHIQVVQSFHPVMDRWKVLFKQSKASLEKLKIARKMCI